MVDLKNEIEFHAAEEKQAYLIAIEGRAEINKIELNERDALEITEKNSILITIKKRRQETFFF